jgi:hypothetical protein
VCLPPLTILFRKRENRGPTQSILRGESNGLSPSQNSKRKTKSKFGSRGINGARDDTLLTGEYLELEEGSNYTLGVEKPNNAYMIGVKGGAGSTTPDGSTQDIQETAGSKIVKTVKIEQRQVYL